MNDKTNDRPFSETIGTPHLTARLIENIRDEFFIIVIIYILMINIY